MQRITNVISGLALGLALAVAGSGQAQQTEIDPLSATAWLDRATPLLVEVPTDEEAYSLADLLVGIMKAEATAGRTDRVAALFPKLQEASMKITLLDGDTWSMMYLPAGHYLSGREEDAKAAAENLAFKPSVHLDAYQLLAEAADAVGDDAGYNAFTAKMLSLFPQVITKGVEDAQADEYSTYAGTYSAWFAGNAMRQRGDLENLRRLATIGLVDPMEQAAILGMLAQGEMVAGNDEAARASLNKAVDLAELAAQRNQEDAEQDTYWPDANNALPELIAAVWVLDGQEAAAEKGRAWAAAFEDKQVDWQCASALHAAESLRQMRQADTASAALTAAITALNIDPENFTFETAWIARELLLQDRGDEAQAMALRPGSATFQASMALGMADGLLAKEKWAAQ